MKRMFFLAAGIAAISLISCNDKTGTDTPSSGKDTANGKMTQEEKEERNKKVALESLEGINDHNPDKITKNVAANFIDYNDGSMPKVDNIDTMKKYMGYWFTSFPDVKVSDSKAVADGDWVFVWSTWSGTWKGDMMGRKASQKSYKQQDVDIFKFNDEGKITEHRNVVPASVVDGQVGFK